MPDIDLGDNYKIEEDSNGDLVIRDTTAGSVVMKYDRSAGEWKSISSLSVDQAVLNGADGHTIGGDTLVGVEAGWADVNLSLGSWRQADADRPALVLIDALAETDGTTQGRIRLDIDESGGTSADHFLDFCWADTGLGSGGRSRTSVMVLLNAGAQYRVTNNNDPNNNNTLTETLEMVL